MRAMRIYLIRKTVALTMAAGILSICGIASAAPETNELATIGQALFFDTNLSANRTQSCATCHEPGNAFSDGRESAVSGAVSLGDDGESLGDRNTPGTTYAFLIPEFHRNDQGKFVGGYFLDGRAAIARSIHEFARQALNHGVFRALARAADQPTEGQGLGPVGAHINGHLIGGATDTTRADSPLTRVPDAVLIDTTDLAPDEVVSRLLAEVRGRLG